MPTPLPSPETPLRPSTSGVGRAVRPLADLHPLVRLEPGRFLMGSPESEIGRKESEGPQHWVTISRPFFLGETEVTQDLWARVMGNNPAAFRGCGLTCPVQNISWSEALVFCNRLSEMEGLSPCYRTVAESPEEVSDCTGYRLPTEAEWEYAARAGRATMPEITETECGPDENLQAVAWYCGNSAVTYADCVSLADAGGPTCAGVHPARTKPANPWGLYDMQGNVFEWVWDREGPYPGAAATDPRGPETGAQRMMRGGSWRALARHCRAANRRANSPDYRMSVIGLRLARNAP